jgi:spore coat protein CotH
VVQTFELELPEESLQALRERTRFDDPANEVYVQGTLRHGDTVLESVGVRFKGEGSFRPLDGKSAWKIKLDEFVPEQHLGGLKRLTFNNMVEDPSFLAERLAYHVYRALDLPAPRCNAALVLVNGESYGLYANIEAEDKPFLRRWFDEDGGNLYEEGQSDFVPGAETTFSLQTNEEANDRSDLVALIDAAESVASGASWSDLDGVLNTDHFLRFTAAEAAVNQWDMYAYTRFYPNNFRLYADPALGLTFLPWGMDMSMKPFRDSGKPHVRIFELARQGDYDGGQVIAGRIYRLCLEDPVCIEEYSAAVSDVADAYEALDLEALAQRYYEQILPLVEDDPRKEYSMQDFETGYQSLLSTIRERPEAMRADLAER